MKLSNSRRALRRVVWNSSSEIWGQLHEAAFAKGFWWPRRIRSDSTTSKKACCGPISTIPSSNPLYAKMLEHYGVVPLPCRATYAPDLKGKVESEVGYHAEDGAEGPSVRRASRNKMRTWTIGMSAGR